MIKRKILSLFLSFAIIFSLMAFPFTANAETYTVSNTTVYLTDLTDTYYPVTHVHRLPNGSTTTSTGDQSSYGGCFTRSWTHTWETSGPSGLMSVEEYDDDFDINDQSTWGSYHTYLACAQCGAPATSWGHCTVTETHSETLYACNCGRSTSTVLVNPNVRLENGKIHCTINAQDSISNVRWTLTGYDMDGSGATTTNLNGNTVDLNISKPKYKVTATFNDVVGTAYTINNIPPFIAAITVDYNGTDNTGGATASHLIYYTDYTANTGRLSSNGFTRDGYDFVIWNSRYSNKLEQLGVSLNPGRISKAQIDSIAGGYNSFTMYAVWKAHPYSIEFYPANPNFIEDDLKSDGTVVNVNTYKYTQTGFKYHDSKDMSAKTTFLTNKYTKVGYKFLGWGFTPQTHTWDANIGVILSSPNVAYSNMYAGDNIRIPNGNSTRSPNNNEVIKLYAQWEPIEFTLTIHSNDQYNSVDEPVGDVSGHNIDIPCTYDRYVTISDALSQFNTWYNDPIVTGLCSKEDYLLVNSVYQSTEQDLRFGDGAFVELTLNASETGYTNSQKIVTSESKTPNEVVGTTMDLDHIFYADTRMTTTDNSTLHIYCIRDIYHIFYNEDTNKPTKIIYVLPDGTAVKLKGIFMNDMTQSRSREYLIFGH